VIGGLNFFFWLFESAFSSNDDDKRADSKVFHSSICVLFLFVCFVLVCCVIGLIAPYSRSMARALFVVSIIVCVIICVYADNTVKDDNSPKVAASPPGPSEPVAKLREADAEADGDDVEDAGLGAQDIVRKHEGMSNMCV
jgi:glucan phosphoethanolaminetransferase (alkaline phosphatase superfamily)